MKYLICLLLGFSTLLTLPAQAQRKTKVKTKGDVAVSAANRLQPLFGGISPAQAQALVGAAFLADVERSFPSKTEASRFFSTKGYEYLTEGKPDTAVYRFNLAWLLDPKNAEAYRGLGVVASRNPTPDQSISLLTQGLALAPNDALMLADLGSSYLIRYEQTKKKKDLTTGNDYLQRAVATDPKNAAAWQQLARVYYLQEDYTKAWDATHKGGDLSINSIDFNFLSELMTKMPDPQGKFK
ncbi:tetratricopeptide repeat protein [Hymenobacter sp.]|jgi:tetratricopeptide (TPR) repeat protein|uniref:tetratricopeptide repeat protein n=1 Tax=Hymenobacter sp. TaxID=1898978 RepID=UPI002ED85F61